MKKNFLLIGAAMLVASCTTITKTATTADMPASLLSATVADLEPLTTERVSYVMQNVSPEIRRGGLPNVKKSAEHELLNQYKGDVLVEPEYIISKKRYLFRTVVTSVTVSGRPARYVKFHSLKDDVWCDPVFRGRLTNDVKKSGGLLKGILGK